MLDALGKRLRRAHRQREDAPVAQAPERDATAGPAPEPAQPDRPSWDRDACPAALQAALDRLDADQLRAVLAEGDIAVCAAVGSGKTTVLVHRVLVLHLVRGVPLERIAVLTFTRKAAAEIAQRLASDASAGEQGQGATWLFGTFHGVARSLLAEALPVGELGFRRDFRILDASERDALWRDLIARHDLEIKHQRQLARRMEGLAEGQVRYGQMRRDDDLVRLAELYEDEKRALNAMDYDDLIHGATALLAHLPDDRRPWQIVVDELQDCDEDQLDLVDALRGSVAGPDASRARVFAVGDPHQTIYGWRGSGGDIFERFVERFGARRLALPRNYRSSATLVHAAQGLLVGGGAILAPEAADLRPTRPDGAQIEILRHHDALAEADWVAEQLARRVRSRGHAGGLAVLARTRKQLEPIAAALERRQIPVARAVTRQDDEEAARWLHALLRAGLRDDLAALRIALADADRGLVRPGQLGDTSLAADEAQVSATARVEARIVALARRSKRVDLPRAHATLAALRTLAEAMDVAEARRGVGPAHDGDLASTLAADLASHLGIADLLRPTRARAAAELALAQGLLRAWCARAIELADAHAPRSAADRLAQALDEAWIDRDWLLDAGSFVGSADAAGARGALALTTIHAAKGLEWDEVWLVGCNDGVLPIHGALTSPRVLAEEQRLLFVAITRARDALHVGWLTAPDQPRALPEPSPLLRLLPASTVRWLQEPERTRATDEALPWPPVGTTVRHPSHGVGLVVAADAGAIEVRFERGGNKRLARAFARLEPCEA